MHPERGKYLEELAKVLQVWIVLQDVELHHMVLNELDH